MHQWLTPPPYEGGDPFDRSPRWVTSERFAYAGWEDPIHEVCELVERGLHGRRLGDDVAVEQREHKRLEAQRNRDLRSHERSMKFEGEEHQREVDRQRAKSARYRKQQGPTMTAEEREERRLARREQKLVEELRALGYIVLKRE